MKKLTAVLLLTLLFVVPAFADGPADEERPSDAHDKMISNQVNKPQRKLSTVGPVPVGTVPQAAVLPGSGGLNAKELNVFVAPPGGVFRNGGTGQGGNNNPPEPAPTTIVVP